MKALLIDPVTRTISDVTLSMRNLSGARALIDCEYVELSQVAPDGVLVIDEEGLLKQQQSFFRLPTCGHSFAGKALLFGGRKNRLQDVPLPSADLLPHIHWLSAVEVKLVAASGAFDTTFIDLATGAAETFPLRPDVKPTR
jgi:hypothetical protein